MYRLCRPPLACGIEGNIHDAIFINRHAKCFRDQYENDNPNELWGENKKDIDSHVGWIKQNEICR